MVSIEHQLSIVKVKLQQNNMKALKAQKINNKSTKKSVYKKYSFESRKKLISLVEDDNRTLASSANELGICQTTARLIISTWRQEGRVFEKKTEKERRLRRQAKKEVNAQRKMKSQRQRAEIEEGAQIPVGPIVTSSSKQAEVSENIQNGPILEAVVQVARAENPEPSPQQQHQLPTAYQIVQISGIYYIQPLYVMPSLYGWP